MTPVRWRNCSIFHGIKDTSRLRWLVEMSDDPIFLFSTCFSSDFRRKRSGIRFYGAGFLSTESWYSEPSHCARRDWRNGLLILSGAITTNPDHPTDGPESLYGNSQNKAYNRHFRKQAPINGGDFQSPAYSMHKLVVPALLLWNWAPEITDHPTKTRCISDWMDAVDMP